MEEGLVSASEGRGHAVELRKEAYTMALYVAISLLAALNAAVALLVSIPVLILPPFVELQVAEFELAAFIPLVGYAVARRGGGRRARGFAYALAMLAVGVGIAALRNVLAGH